MPWKECKPMDERLRFIARLLEGEKMAVLCREFGISRVTGYKIYHRYRECGLDALYDRSRRPYRHANKLPFQIERSILGIYNLVRAAVDGAACAPADARDLTIQPPQVRARRADR